MDLLQNVLNQFIRPMLNNHGGDVSVVSYENGTLVLKLQGQCLGCASSDFTTDIIEKELKQRIPEIKEILFDQSVSPELLAMAKEILGKKK